MEKGPRDQSVPGVPMDESARYREEMYRMLSMIDSIIIGVTVRDIVTHWNRTAEDVFGIKEADAIGRPISGLALNWDWPVIFEGIGECFISGRTVTLQDITMVRADSGRRVLGVSITPIKTTENAPRGFIVLGKDITDKKIMEMQLLQDQKLKSIGELASGIAHEINTPIQYVNDNTIFFYDSFKQLLPVMTQMTALFDVFNMGGDVNAAVRELMESAEKADFEYLTNEIPKSVEQTIEGIVRISSIVKSLKSFAHPDTKEKVPTDINKTVADAVVITRNEWKYSSDIEHNPDRDLPEVRCYPAEISQVLLNIIINASHAVKEAIEAGRIERGKIVIETLGKKGYAEIVITDNGIGMSEEVLRNIYDPFFTTKEVGKGTGQGLAISHSIVVKKHGGRIFCKSSPGRGSSFFIQLPY